MLEIAEVHSRDIPIIAWCVSSLDTEGICWKYVRNSEIEWQNKNSTLATNSVSLENNVWRAEKGEMSTRDG